VTLLHPSRNIAAARDFPFVDVRRMAERSQLVADPKRPRSPGRLSRASRLFGTSPSKSFTSFLDKAMMSLCLAAVKADGADHALQSYLAERGHFGRTISNLEKRASHLVDANVGCLGREHDRDEERERV
jgi:hypothetical protein